MLTTAKPVILNADMSRSRAWAAEVLRALRSRWMRRPAVGLSIGRSAGHRPVDPRRARRPIRRYAGSVMWLTLPTIGHVAATVRRAADFDAGYEFIVPLEPEPLAMLVAA